MESNSWTGKFAFWYSFKPRKIGWSAYDRRDLRVDGRSSLKYLKKGWNRTEGRGHKDFKKGVQAGSRVGCLKRGLKLPYKLWCYKYELMRQVQVSSTWLISELCLTIYLRKLNLLQMQKVRCRCLHAQQPCKNFTHLICIAIFPATFDMSSQHKCQQLF